jgi:hypothetical protein
MTRNHEKLVIAGRIQDCVVVSIYPAPLNMMQGITEGKPKVIASEDELGLFCTFFIEISLTHHTSASSNLRVQTTSSSPKC